MLYWFIEAQAHFGIPRVAKMCMTLNNQNSLLMHSKSNTTSEHAPQVERIY
jgi:hypothetical protein